MQAANGNFLPIADMPSVVHDVAMRKPEGSRRTKVLFWLYSAVLAVSLSLALWLFVILAAHFVFDLTLPTPPLVRWMTIAVIPLVALRLAITWSVKSDRS